jgi:hypothetical protein
MSQLTFRSLTHLAFVHLLRKAGVGVQAAWRALKRYWGEATVIPLLLLAGIVIRIARMAAANPAVAQALSHAAQLLGLSGT